MTNKLDKERIKEGIGGQAVIEGIMLRNKTHYVVAVRKPDNKIDYIKDIVKDEGSKLSKTPFIRGVVNFVSMMKLGYSTLIFSANISLPEGEKKEEITPLAMTLTLLSSLLIAVSLFIALPYVATTLLGIDEKSNIVLFNITRGLIKIAIFVSYLLIISLFKDIRRVFEYHGAEHMVVNAYEHGKYPTKENIVDYTTIHPRCGTTFLFLVLSVSIVLYMFTSYFVYSVVFASGVPNKIIGNLTVLSINILFLPIVSGISYELLKIGFKLNKFKAGQLFILPGLLLQKITTKMPKEDEIEVALFALEKLLDNSVMIRTESDIENEKNNISETILNEA